MAKTKKAWFVGKNAIGVVRLNSIEGKELKLADLYPIIGDGCNIVERVALKKGVDMWVDEEGLLKNDWVMNPIGTDLYRKAYPHVDPRELGIAGNAVIIDNTKAGNFF